MYTTCDAAAGETVKLPDVAEVRLPSAAVNVYVPTVFTFTLLNVATPLPAATVNVPLRLPGPLALLSVTFELSPVTMFPNWSSTSTTIDGLFATPAVTLLG